jgi:hypothetical protein
MSLFRRRPKNADAQSQDDVVAIERYEYLLATAQPDMINRMHIEAFEKLTPEARQSLFERLTADAPTAADKPIDAGSATLARLATDAETARPGSLLRILGPQGAASHGDKTLLATIAALIVASPLATTLFPYDYGAGTGLWVEDADDGLDY